MSKIEFIVTKESERIAVDNESIFGGGCINHRALVESAFRPGEYHMLVKMYGCGLEMLVIVEHKDGKILWHIPEQEATRGKEERWFVFDALQYRLALLEGFKKIPAMRNNEFRSWISYYGISKKEVVNAVERLKASIPTAAVMHPSEDYSIWSHI